MKTPAADRRIEAAREWLVGDGEMAAAIRALDWSATALGPRDRWPGSLRTVVNLLVASRFPMALLWGRELLLVYNDAYRAIAGGKHPAALGRSTREIWPEVWHLNEPIFAAVLERGETVYLEDACFPIDRHGCREDAYFTLCYTPVRIGGGAVGGALVTLEETTARGAERRRAHEALRDRTALLQAISDTSSDVIFAKDRDGRMRFANPAALALIGKRAAEVLGRTDAEFLDDAGAARAVMETDRRIMERGDAEDVEEQVPLPDGTQRIWLSRKSPLRGAAGEVVGLVGISRDITDRKRAEEAVRAAEERYRTLFTGMTEGFAVGEPILDDTGVPRDVRFLEMNAAFERQTSLDVERIRGRPLREVLPGLEPEWIETYGRVALSGAPVRFESYNRDLDRHFSVYCYRPAPGRFAIVFTDVTARVRAEEAVRDSEQRLRSVLDNMVEGLVIFDASGNITHQNPASVRIHDRRLSGERQRLDQLTVNWRVRRYPEGDVVPPEDWAIPRVLRGDRVRSERFFVDCLEDPRRSFVGIYSGSPVHDARGRFAYGFLTIEDITEQARAEGALRETNERLRALFEGTAVGMVEVDEADRFVAVNGRFCAMLGYAREELLGRRPEDITAPEDLATTVELNARGRSGELDQLEYETRYVRKDGTRLWVHVTVSVARDPSGRFVRAVGTAEDVTERRRSREALRASEERWNAAIEHFGEGAIIATEDEQVIYWNPAARALHGFATEREGLGPLSETPATFELWTPDGSRLLTLDEWPMRRLKRGETVRKMELRLRRPDQGWEKFVSYSGAVVRTGGGERLVFLSVTDLTEQRRAEQALRDADRRKDEFLGMLSHELRNPLAPIRNSLYILERADPAGPQARRAKEVANRQLAHLTRLVDDLLDVTRIARGKVELRRGELDLAALARRTAEDHRALMQDRHLHLEVQVPDRPIPVDGDETRLAQVLGNLLHNAAKFTPGGGRVTVAVEAGGAQASISVRDTGAGIAPQVLPTIFEPFTQAEQTLARSEGGLGLGLALVKGLVALHGGDVAARSEGPGRGTEFVVTLPLAAARRAETPGRASGRSTRPRARDVLVIDDNRDAAESLAELVSLFGHAARVAHDAFDGLASAAEDMPDVVFCDIGLPGMDGYEFARQLRALSATHRVQLVAVSGYAQPEDVARALEAGFDAHVAKPPDPEELERLLAGSPEASGRASGPGAEA